ncbi:putative phosphatidylethanolamine-binding protein [Hibiscus syriacus]|uniref:Phosphatidylethanolamine-binding protein n=1 Tax=Hibiscus syriacus TaxID=106335 RepID=A0A6A2ZKP5_HIBSY|nr:putative phosphatidylethanolamine-binding protein [Hibiscus syriacus]
MAVRLLTHELSDLCLGKPALRSLSVTSTIAQALEVLKTSDDIFVSVWSCDHKPKTTPGFEPADDFLDECRCVGKICIVDVICFLCRDENLVSPPVALNQPVSLLLPKIPGLVLHVEPSCRFLLSSIGLFSPIPALSIDTLNIISPNFITSEYHSPASAAIGAISRALVEQTSVAVVDSEGALIGEISPFTLACCDETVAAAVKTLSLGDLMAYIDCGGPPEELVKVVSAKLKEENLNGMLQHFTFSMFIGGFSSASSSSDEEYSMAASVLPMPRPGRLSRSMSYSARMVRRSEAIVCHPKSSLVAVMIQAIAHRVNYVWVIEDDCSLVGIVTFSDMLKVFRKNVESMA